MSKNKKMIFLTFIVLVILGTFGINTTTSRSIVNNKSDNTSLSLQEVDSKYVCMINNKLFDKTQIPIEVEGRTYYGCCEMCKGRLANDPDSRIAVDPLSENKVDKALSVTAANPDGDVYYFENEKNLHEFNRMINQKK